MVTAFHYRIGMPSIDLTTLRIESSCPADDDVLVEGGRGYTCSECRREVVAVARHTQAEMRTLLGEAEALGERMCVELLVRTSDGAVLYADGHLVKPSPPRKRTLPVLAASLALVACTPRDEASRHDASAMGSSALVAPALPSALSSAPTVSVPSAPSSSAGAETNDGGCANGEGEGDASTTAKPKTKIPPHHRQLRGGPRVVTTSDIQKL